MGENYVFAKAYYYVQQHLTQCLLKMILFVFIFREMVYKNWYKHEPNNVHFEHCMHLTRSFQWKWNDHRCTYQKYFICEINFLNEI